MATFRRAGEPSSATDSISGRDASQGTILLSQDVVSLVLDHIGGLRGLSDASRICRAFRDGAAAKSEEWRVLSVKGSFGTQGADRGMLFAPNFVLALQQGILVSDGSNCRLQLFSPTGASLWTIGSFGIGEESFHPRGTASDGKALWLADTNRHRVLRLSLSDGKLLASVGARGGGAGQLCFPTGLALAGATLAVTDTSNDRVVLLDAHAMRWRASFGQHGSAPGQFNHPCGCAVLPGADGAVQLLVADAFNHRLQLFTLGGGIVRAFGSKGTLPGQLLRPHGVAVSRGRVFVSECDGHRVQVLTPEGHPLQVLPLPQSGGLYGLCVRERTLFAADFGKHTVHVLDVRGATAETSG